MAKLACRLACCALIAVLTGGCSLLRRADSDQAAARSHDEWTTLAGEIKAFQRRIGFEETNNFLRFSGEKEAFLSCGQVSRLYLPYSYQDPAIQWLYSISEKECRALGKSADVTFVSSEALGEIETPVTPSMLAAPLHRLLYVVIHEDCHEQFELPYGIEEALCNVIAYKAMAAFGEERFGAMPAEFEAIKRYASDASRQTHLTVALYARLSALYMRHSRSEVPLKALLRERERIFREAERELASPKGSMNNVSIANYMTYSRHYPLLERVFDALGRDLARTVDFFKHVDAIKPPTAEVVARNALKSDSGLEFIRAYEAAVVETIERALAKIGNAL